MAAASPFFRPVHHDLVDSGPSVGKYLFKGPYFPIHLLPLLIDAGGAQKIVDTGVG
jgi:hypothetical protein